MKKNRILIIIGVILLLCVGFIFGNSLKDGPQTVEDSHTIKDIIDNVFDFLKIDFEISEQDVRTLGHFCEFFALCTILTGAALLLFPIDYKKPYSIRLLIYFSPVLISTVIAFADEFIQLFSPGRACDIMDVLVDFLGALTANVIIMGITLIICKIKKRKD